MTVVGSHNSGIAAKDVLKQKPCNSSLSRDNCIVTKKETDFKKGKITILGFQYNLNNNPPPIRWLEIMIICYFSRVWVHWLDLLLWALLTPAAVISWDRELIQRFSQPLLPGFFSQKAQESKGQRRCSQVLFQKSLLIWWGKQIASLGLETEQRRIKDAEQKETSLIWTMKETDPLHRGNTRNGWFASRALGKSSVFSTTYSPRI